MSNIIKIGTRDSELALWQANSVKRQLEELGYETQIVPIKATGDLVLDTPLYELGITGIFTRNLDIALLNNDIDIAVHSLKDVPTVLPKGIVQASVLKRGNHNDMLVFKDNEEFMSLKDATIATGSLRRKAQWLYRYPTHTIVGLRGNVNTRLRKVEENEELNGAIFAAAGLNRIKLTPETSVNLNWMIPAPAQGAIMITALAENEYAIEAAAKLNNEETELCTTIERDFLNALEGGCTAPIGGYAYIKDEEVHFKGALLSKDGKQKIEVSKITKISEAHTIARYCAGTIIQKGGKQIMLDDFGETPKEIDVFSTKKLSESQIKLFHEDIEVNDSDFIKTRFNRIPPKVVRNEIENVVITSRNAVESLLNSFSADELQFKNIYCVGRRTKALIEKRIGKVLHAEKNSKALATYLIANLKGKELTYFCGDLRRDELPDMLAENGIEVNEIEAYQAIYSGVEIDEKVKGILFYSPSTVTSYLEKNNPDRIAFCIGATTASEAKKHFKDVQIANVPTVESVIELVNLHFIKAK
jgi:hydroxymethylbilane synthase